MLTIIEILAIIIMVTILIGLAPIIVVIADNFKEYQEDKKRERNV